MRSEKTVSFEKLLSRAINNVKAGSPKETFLAPLTHEAVKIFRSVVKTWKGDRKLSRSWCRELERRFREEPDMKTTFRWAVAIINGEPTRSDGQHSGETLFNNPDVISPNDMVCVEVMPSTAEKMDEFWAKYDPRKRSLADYKNAVSAATPALEGIDTRYTGHAMTGIFHASAGLGGSCPPILRAKILKTGVAARFSKFLEELGDRWSENKGLYARLKSKNGNAILVAMYMTFMMSDDLTNQLTFWSDLVNLNVDVYGVKYTEMVLRDLPKGQGLEKQNSVLDACACGWNGFVRKRDPKQKTAFGKKAPPENSVGIPWSPVHFLLFKGGHKFTLPTKRELLDLASKS